MNPEQQVMTLFGEWNAAVRRGDPDELVALYAPDAVLLPTLSDRVRCDTAAIRDYFEGFLANRPHAELDFANTRVFGDIAINSGVYTFRFEAGPIHTVRARFTFVYRSEAGRWLIVEHHSSVLPEQCKIEYYAAGVPERCKLWCASGPRGQQRAGVTDAAR